MLSDYKIVPNSLICLIFVGKKEEKSSVLSDYDNILNGIIKN